jgi:hypothetical protein
MKSILAVAVVSWLTIGGYSTAARADDMVGTAIATPDGAPVVATLTLEAPMTVADVTSSAADSVAVVAIARPDGRPLVAAVLDPSMDTFDAPDQLFPQDMPSVSVIGYHIDYEKQVPPGEYLVYAAGQTAATITFLSAVGDMSEAQATDRMSALFDVRKPANDLDGTINSRLPLQRGPKSVTTTFALVAVRNHQVTWVENCVVIRGDDCIVGNAYGTKTAHLSPGGVGNGWVGRTYNVYPGTLDGEAVDAVYMQTGAMQYHRATLVGLNFHVT